MLTGPSDPRPRRYRPLLALAAGLLIALAATSGAIALAERDGTRTANRKCSGSMSTSAPAAGSDSATEAATAAASGSGSATDERASTGLDLEVRIGRIRVEFPWLKTLPITPGRHVVFTLLPASDRDSE